MRVSLTLPPILLLASILFFIAPPPCIAAQALWEKTFPLKAEAEVALDLLASSPNMSWDKEEQEAAVVTVFVDGRYQQDIILFRGDQFFSYSVILGRYRPGVHLLRIEQNREWSASKAARAVIRDAQITAIDSTQDSYRAVARSPILYARRNTLGRFSDIPLLVWYETAQANGSITLRYSVIFSNEDGGTEVNALMARWGRATDIEWMYEVKLDAAGTVVEDHFQGIEHRIRRFRGRRDGDHPILRVASDNNNFSDKGTSAVRFALRPVPFDPGRHSREELMDRHPWTYQIMALELKREGKIGASNIVGSQIADPRDYLFLEAISGQRDAALSFAVKLRDDPKWYTSDLGIDYFKVERSGAFRTTIRLPIGATLAQIERIAARCDMASPRPSSQELNRLPEAGCDLKAVSKAFFLNKNYEPGPALRGAGPARTLRPGDMVELSVRSDWE